MQPLSIRTQSLAYPDLTIFYTNWSITGLTKPLPHSINHRVVYSQLLVKIWQELLSIPQKPWANLKKNTNFYHFQPSFSSSRNSKGTCHKFQGNFFEKHWWRLVFWRELFQRNVKNILPCLTITYPKSTITCPNWLIVGRQHQYLCRLCHYQPKFSHPTHHLPISNHCFPKK